MLAAALNPAGGSRIEDHQPARGARVPTDDSPTSPEGERGPGSTPQPARGPAGEEREPLHVALWTVLTLGIYQLYWLWISSRSVDRYDPRASSPFRVARWAIPLNVVGAVGLLVAGVLLVQSTGLTPEAIQSGTADFQNLDISRDLLVLALVAVGAALVGGIGVLVAYWRLWSFVQDSERRQGRSDPIRPGLMLTVVVGAGLAAQLIPLVGFLLGPLAWAYVLYRSQEGLNWVWDETRGRSEPEGFDLQP